MINTLIIMSLLQSPFPSSRDLLTTPSALFSMGGNFWMIRIGNSLKPMAPQSPGFCFSSRAYNSEMPTSLCHWKLSTSGGTDAKAPNEIWHERTPGWWARMSLASSLPELGAGMQRWWAEFRAASKEELRVCEDMVVHFLSSGARRLHLGATQHSFKLTDIKYLSCGSSA